jgi:hypothetical protein
VAKKGGRLMVDSSNVCFVARARRIGISTRQSARDASAVR